ncbi:helix-turn-helix domain-containing protein [Actinokineospora sp. NPDC004072]
MGQLNLGPCNVTVVENGHFGHAATQLGITQQAVSKRVARLEVDSEVVLLSRPRSGKLLAERRRADVTFVEIRKHSHCRSLDHL